MTRPALAIQDSPSNDDRRNRESPSLCKAKHRRKGTPNLWDVKNTYRDNDRLASVILHKQSMPRPERRMTGPCETPQRAKSMPKSYVSDSGNSTTDEEPINMEEEQLLSEFQDHSRTLSTLHWHMVPGSVNSRHSSLVITHPEVFNATALTANFNEDCKVGVSHDLKEQSPEEDEKSIDMLRKGKNGYPMENGFGRSYDQGRKLWRYRLQQQNSDPKMKLTRPRMTEPKTWSKVEDRLLLAMYTEGKSWGCVSKALPGRSKSMCRAHWWRVLSMKHPDTSKTRYRKSRKCGVEDHGRRFAVHSEGRARKSVFRTIPGYTSALRKARSHQKHRYPGVLERKNIDTSASWPVGENNRLKAIYSQDLGWEVLSRILPKSTPRTCQRCGQILRNKKMHAEITPNSKCKRIRALTIPRASEYGVKDGDVAEENEVPADRIVVSEKCQTTDAAPAPCGKRIKGVISQPTNHRYFEYSTFIAQETTSRTTVQELGSDSETTSEAYVHTAGKAWWIAFASEVLEEAQDMIRSRSGEEDSSIGDDKCKRWDECVSRAQVAPYKPDYRTAEENDDNDDIDDYMWSPIGDFPIKRHIRNRSSLSDAVTLSTRYVMTDVETSSGWNRENNGPAEPALDGKSRQRCAILSLQAQSHLQQPESHAKALADVGIGFNSTEPLAKNVSVDIRNSKSKPTREGGCQFPLLKAEAARRRGVEAFLRCAAQEDE